MEFNKNISDMLIKSPNQEGNNRPLTQQEVENCLYRLYDEHGKLIDWVSSIDKKSNGIALFTLLNTVISFGLLVAFIVT